jgi:O-antigen/teichoic acid export membrane protein
MTRLNNLLKHKGVRRYAGNTGWLFVARISTLVVAFFVSSYMARQLGPADYGTLSYVLSFIGIFSIFANLGIDNVLYRELAMHPEKEDEIMGSGFVLKMIGSLLSITLILFTLIFLKNGFRVNLFIIIASLSFFLQSFNVILYHFQAKAESKKIAVSALFVVTVLALIKIALLLLKFGLVYFVWLIVVEQVLYAYIFVVLYRREGKSVRAWKLRPELMKSLWRESMPLLFSSAFVLVYNRIDQLMIKQMIDIATVGLYDVAVKISEFWYFLPNIFLTALLPAIVNAKKTDPGSYKRRLRLIFSGTLLVSLVMAVFIYLVSHQVILSLFGEAYLPAVSVVKVYVWAGIGMTIGTVVNQYLVIESATTTSFFANFFGMLLNIILNILFIPKYGMIGAAYATLISYFASPLLAVLIRWKKFIYD